MFVCFFKQKTAYEMRISDWSSDVCSSDLRLDGDCLTCTGRTIAENIQGCESRDREVIRPFGDPLMEKAGYLALSGNLFDLGILKSSVISDELRARYLARPGHEGVFEGREIVFDGSDDYTYRINDQIGRATV